MIYHSPCPILVWKGSTVVAIQLLGTTFGFLNMAVPVKTTTAKSLFCVGALKTDAVILKRF